jgi:hypothetical protein
VLTVVARSTSPIYERDICFRRDFDWDKEVGREQIELPSKGVEMK